MSKLRNAARTVGHFMLKAMKEVWIFFKAYIYAMIGMLLLLLTGVAGMPFIGCIFYGANLYTQAHSNTNFWTMIFANYLSGVTTRVIMDLFFPALLMNFVVWQLVGLALAIMAVSIKDRVLQFAEKMAQRRAAPAS
jgi:hypothetical protein